MIVQVAARQAASMSSRLMVPAGAKLFARCSPVTFALLQVVRERETYSIERHSTVVPPGAGSAFTKRHRNHFTYASPLLGNRLLLTFTLCRVLLLLLFIIETVQLT